MRVVMTQGAGKVGAVNVLIKPASVVAVGLLMIVVVVVTYDITMTIR